MLFNIYNSYLCYEEKVDLINDYYQCIVEFIKKILTNNPEFHINISLCNNNYTFNNDNKTIKININCEHTIVKKGGRGVPIGTPTGKIMDNNNDYYYVRIEGIDGLKNSDIIIDYSIPNIYNVSTLKEFEYFSKKHIYISSSIYELYFLKENRNINSLTTFINIYEERRFRLLQKMQDNRINHVNVNNCFDKQNLQQLYKNTKILINIHQTDHHHRFEEFRVLPALECGVIVISEKSPLYELVPYNDYIIWSTYEEIIDKFIHVINNYDYYHESIFNKEKKQKLNTFNNINYNTLKDAISLHL